MKSLNRTLSLVLVLAMVLGLMGIASAATFTDATKVQYTEAVGVMSGIGAINGYTDGSFNPTGTITREEAAKLVAYTVLGATTAKTLSVTTTGFSDVAAARWSAPFIAYCVNAGIINGMGDGTFAPTANVTGYQLAKMLLCALGYGKKGEFTGDAWELNSAVLATSAGLFDNAKTVSFSVAATREEAALYCFNALFAQKVAYSKDTESYVGLTKTVTTTRYGRTTTSSVPVTIASVVYPTLAKSTTTMDAYGRPATVWVYGTPAVSIAVATDTPIFTSTSPVKIAATKLALINQGYSIAEGDVIDLYTNGKHSTITVPSDATIAGLSSPYLTGNGQLIEVYADSDDQITTIVLVNTYLAVVTADKLTKDNAATTTVDERAFSMTTVDQHYKTIVASAAKGVNPATTGFDAAWAAIAYQLTTSDKAYVLVVPYNDNTVNGDYAMSVAVPGTTTGVLTSYTADTSVTVGGKTYGYSAMACNAAYIGGTNWASLLTSANITAGTSLTLALDSYGNILGISGVASVPNYAYVIDKANGSGLDASTCYAKLLLADGTVKTVTTATLATASDLVTYTVNATTGVYTLTHKYVAVTDPDFVITQGLTAMTNFGSGTTPVYANASTIFLIGTTSTATSYTMVKGIANVGSLTGVGADSAKELLGYVVGTSGYADVVFVKDATVTGTSTTAPTYIYADSSAAITDATGTYYNYNAIVNGAITTVKVASGVLSDGANVCSAVTYTSGIVTAVTSVASSALVSSSNGGTTADVGGVIKLAGTPYSYSTTAVVYYVDATTHVITASSIAALATDANDGFTAVTSSGVVTALYVVSK